MIHLFFVPTDYFFEIGLYDPGLEIWGGENFELSYKVIDKFCCSGFVNELLLAECHWFSLSSFVRNCLERIDESLRQLFIS